jgi:ABC-type transporter Mla subunit MlaD
MTIDDLQKQAELIADSQQKFIETIRDLSQLVDSLIQHQSSLMNYLNKWRDLFAASRDLMQEQTELHKESLEALKAVAKALADSTVSTNENNDLLEKLIVKVDSYFGTGEGLNYEN